jgi:hypothetical protein
VERVVRTDSAGVQLVRHAQLPQPPEWPVSAEPILSIGAADGEEPYLFTTISSVDRLSNGQLVVAEGSAAEIRIFDRQGGFVRGMGRRGEGPGEFAWVDRARVLDGDSMLAWDGRLRRISVFDSAGELVRTENVTAPRAGPLIVEDVFSDGSLLLVVLDGNRGTYAYFDPRSLAEPTSIVTIENEATYTDAEGRFWPIPFVARHSIATSPDRLYVATGDAFGYEAYGTDGSLLLDVAVYHDPQPLTSEAIDAYKEQRRAELQQRAEQAARQGMVVREPPLDELPYPDVLPVIDDLLIDAAGLVWLRAYTHSASDAHAWHVFDAEGEYRAVVRIPPGLRVMRVEEEAVLGSWTDDLGVRTLRVYSLDRGDTR